MADFHGNLHLRAEPRPDGRTVLGEQAFRAPYHLSKPYWDEDSRTLITQVVNPTAGILSGDRLESCVTVASGASLLLTTPSSSRVFRMREGSAESVQTFQIESGGWLEVLPEPLVPHRGSVFHQRTSLDVATGGAAFYADLLMPGRVAHGEAWLWEKLVLEVEVRLAGERLLRERFEQKGEQLRALAQMAGSGVEACFGNVVVVGPHLGLSEDLAWRDHIHRLHGEGLWIGASPLRNGGGWSIKFVASDGIRLRQTLASVRRTLSNKCPHLACDARKL